jgi:type IV pilus assembly protein PilB
MQPPMKLRDAMTSRIKIMAKLDIAEKRLPQDGRIKIRYQDGGKT